LMFLALLLIHLLVQSCIHKYLLRISDMPNIILNSRDRRINEIKFLFVLGWIVPPPHLCSSGTSECDLIWKQNLCRFN
jgi:hypothetical protein